MFGPFVHCIDPDYRESAYWIAYELTFRISRDILAPNYYHSHQLYRFASIHKRAYTGTTERCRDFRRTQTSNGTSSFQNMPKCFFLFPFCKCSREIRWLSLCQAHSCSVAFQLLPMNIVRCAIHGVEMASADRRLPNIKWMYWNRLLNIY